MGVNSLALVTTALCLLSMNMVKGGHDAWCCGSHFATMRRTRESKG